MDKAASTLEKHLILGRNADWIQEQNVVIRSRNFAHLLDSSFQLQEITLGPGAQLELASAFSCIEVFLPLVGEIQLDSGLCLEVGEFWTEFVPKEKRTSLHNPFPTESIHVLRISLASDKGIHPDYHTLSESELNEKIHQIWESPDKMYRINLGKISGRSDVNFEPSSSSFALALTGVFEYQKCLLEQGDGLAIKGVEEIELECLTPEGLILILEIGRE